MKRCSRCGEDKALSGFHRGRVYHGGYNARCKACRSEIAAAAYELTRMERSVAWKQKYYADLEGNRRKNLEAYYRHRDALGIKPKRVFASEEERRAAKALTKIRYAQRHPERVRRAQHAYVERFPERQRAANAKQHARRRDAPGEVTGKQWKAIVLFYGNACGQCRVSASERPLTVDHFVPIAKGGTHDWTNVWPLCLACNLRKGTKLLGTPQPPHVTALQATGTFD